MPITINLAPEVEERLRQEAQNRGVAVADFVSNLVDSGSVKDAPDAVIGDVNANVESPPDDLTDEEFDDILSELAELSKDVPDIDPRTYKRWVYYYEEYPDAAA